jgi:polyvinyl alcohol dehydrogenase (cytochrome)
MIVSFARASLLYLSFCFTTLLPSITVANPFLFSSTLTQDAWLNFGGGLENLHFVNTLSPKRVASLQLMGAYEVNGQVSSPPSSIDGILYFTDSEGYIHAVNSKTMKSIWKKFAPTDYSADVNGKKARIGYSINTPAITGDYLIIGNQHNLFPTLISMVEPTTGNSDYQLRYNLFKTPRILGEGDGAWLLIINRHTGGLVSKIQIDDHPLAMVSQSPIVVGNKVYVGISSLSSLMAGLNLGPVMTPAVTKSQFEPYDCCLFYGSVVAVDISNVLSPQIDWTFYTTVTQKDSSGNVLNPSLRTVRNGNNERIIYSGVSVLGGQIAYDDELNLLYFGTGNNYAIPDKVLECFAIAKQDSSVDPETCDGTENHVASIIALHAETGRLAWRRQVANNVVAATGNILGYDTWNLSCGGIARFAPFQDWGGVPTNNCPDISNSLLLGPGRDLDITQGATLKTIHIQGQAVKAVLIGQQSGQIWALDASTGRIIWQRKVSPGGFNGGFQWSSAVDNTNIYASSANSNHQAWHLKRPAKDSYNQTTGGFWSALFLNTGNIRWQTTGPEINHEINENHGELTVVGDAVFAGSYTGFLRGFDVRNGRQLWQFYTGDAPCSTPPCARAVNTAPTVINESLYWAYGYTIKSGINNLPGKANISNPQGCMLLKFSPN